MNWTKTYLSDITNNLDSKRIPLNSAQRAKKESAPLYPYIGANNIMGYIDEYIFDEKIICIAEDGGSWGYNETCAKIYNEKVWVNNHAHVLTAKENLSLDFLIYYLNHTDLNLFINGATRGKLTKTSLNSILIPLPPLETQKKIAAILDEADKLRQLNKQLIAKYEQLTQSLFLDMFGDPVMNPKGWEKNILGKLGRVQTGNTPPRSEIKYYDDSFIEWIKTDNINTPNKLLTKAEEYLSKEGLSKGRFVEKNSILMTCIAGSRKVIGNVALTDRKVAFNQQINAFTPIDGNVNFYYNLFKVGKHHIQNFCTTGMKGIITKGKFETIDFPIPPIHLQNQFAERVQAIEAQKTQAQAALAKSEALFNSLLQEAFTRELVK